MIHSNRNENDTENNRDTLEEVIKELPDDTSPVVMDDCVNEGLYDSNQNYLVD